MATSRPQKRPRSSLVDIGEVTWLAAKDVAQRVSPEEDEQGRSKLEDTDDIEEGLADAVAFTKGHSRVMSVIEEALEHQKEGNEDIDEEELPLSEDEGWADIVHQAWSSVECSAKTSYFSGTGNKCGTVYAVRRAIIEATPGDVVSTPAKDLVFTVFARSGSTWERVYVSLNGMSMGAVALPVDILDCFSA